MARTKVARQRTILGQAQDRAVVVSKMLKDGLRIEVEREPNFGVLDVVLYDKHGYVRTLDCDVTAREAFVMLGGMIEVLHIIGREP